MASFHLVSKSSISPFSVCQSQYSPCKWSFFCSERNPKIFGRKCFGSRSKKLSSRLLIRRRLMISCNLKESDNQSNGEEPPESLFIKELKRRGMTPTSLLEESKKGSYGGEETKFREEDGGFYRANAVSTNPERNLTNQKEQSMALNSEGLEYFGPSFVHDARNTRITIPEYINPYQLLEEERISETAPRLN